MASGSGNYYNPNGSSPPPAAKNIPHTLWGQPRMPLNWGGVVQGVDTAVWTSPVFDMRAYLRGSGPEAPMGVPVWETTSHLYIQVFGLTTTTGNTQQLYLRSRELANTSTSWVHAAKPNAAVANPGDPAQTSRVPVVQVTPWMDLTSSIAYGTNQPDSSILVFAPIGEGYPVRFWQLELQFTCETGLAGPPDITLQAAMY